MIQISILLVAVIAQAANGDAREITIEEVEVAPIVEVFIPAKETGILEGLSIQTGDEVHAHDVVAALESEAAEVAKQLATVEYELAKLNAQSDVDRDYLERSQEVARNQLTRSLQANRESPGTVPEAEVDRLRLGVAQAAMELEKSKRDFAAAKLMEAQAMQRLHAATLTLQRHTIRSPMDGHVDQLFHHPGEWLQAGDPVASIIKTDELRVVAFVQEDLLPAEVAASDVRLSVTLRNGASADFAGKIVSLSRSQRSVTGLVKVTAHIRNQGNRLRPGMWGTLRIRLPAPKRPNLSGGDSRRP